MKLLNFILIITYFICVVLHITTWTTYSTYSNFKDNDEKKEEKEEIGKSLEKIMFIYGIIGFISNIVTIIFLYDNILDIKKSNSKKIYTFILIIITIFTFINYLFIILYNNNSKREKEVNKIIKKFILSSIYTNIISYILILIFAYNVQLFK